MIIKYHIEGEKLIENEWKIKIMNKWIGSKVVKW